MIVFSDRRKDLPDGLWTKCGGCSEIVYNGELSRNLWICPRCNHYFPLPPADRIAVLADEESLVRYEAESRHVACPDEEVCDQAIIVGEIALSGHRLVVSAVNLDFTDANTSLFVCEEIIRAVNHAIDKRLPLLMICTNGNGSQTQNGMSFPGQTLSISTALSRLDKEKLLYVSILAQSNSRNNFPGFACAADVVIEESNITAAPASNKPDPNGTDQPPQTLFQSGMTDMLISRKGLRDTLTDILNFFC